MCPRVGAPGFGLLARMAVSNVCGADLHHLSRGAPLPSSAHGLLGEGSTHCGLCWCHLGSCLVLATIEGSVTGAPEGVLFS